MKSVKDKGWKELKDEHGRTVAWLEPGYKTPIKGHWHKCKPEVNKDDDSVR